MKYGNPIQFLEWSVVLHGEGLRKILSRLQFCSLPGSKHLNRGLWEWFESDLVFFLFFFKLLALWKGSLKTDSFHLQQNTPLSYNEVYRRTVDIPSKSSMSNIVYR